MQALTTQQMREVDRTMIEEYGIELLQMMENAGIALAESAREMLGGDVLHRRTAVLVGGGNNGGGGLVAARHLSNAGAQVRVILAVPAERLRPVPTKQWRILQHMGMPIEMALSGRIPDLTDRELLIDALLGYGVEGDPRGSIADAIVAANATGLPILALDTPSGLDTTTGRAYQPCIRATRTLTLALPKTGLLEPGARPFVGELYLADIGVPPQLYRRLGMEVSPLFHRSRIVPHAA